MCVLPCLRDTYALWHTLQPHSPTQLPTWNMFTNGGPPACTATLRHQSVNSAPFVTFYMLWCLQEAAAHGRLSSDTYKRLNLGVMYQSIVFAALAIRERALLTKPSLM